MLKKFFATAAVAAGLSFSAASGAAVYVESEPNNVISAPNSIDGYFSLGADSEILNATTRPNVSIQGNADGGGGTYDVYSFTVDQAGSVGTFDVDNASFDAYLRLFDSLGNTLAANDDSYVGENYWTLDSFIQYTFNTPGLFFIRIGVCCEGPLSYGGSYELQVSLDNGRSEVPEPATLGLLALGVAGIAAGRRRRTI